MATLDQTDLMDTWHEYKATGDQELRNEIVLHYVSLVKYVAAKVAAGLPSMVERDDLVSYGVIGLLDAIEKFDLNQGVKFETYAVARIRGNIIDELRALDWVPRSIRSKARDIERERSTLERELGRMPDDTELASYMDITVPELWVLLSQAVVMSVGGLNENDSDDDRLSVGDVTYDPASNPEDLYQSQEIAGLLADAVNSMPERSKQILVLYYLSEMTLAEIGLVLGVTESRVCQLQSKVLQSLREALGHGATSAA